MCFRMCYITTSLCNTCKSAAFKKISITNSIEAQSIECSAFRAPSDREYKWMAFRWFHFNGGGSKSDLFKNWNEARDQFIGERRVSERRTQQRLKTDAVNERLHPPPPPSTRAPRVQIASNGYQWNTLTQKLPPLERWKWSFFFFSSYIIVPSFFIPPPPPPLNSL